VLAPHAKLRSAVIATAGPSEALACQLRAAAERMELTGADESPALEPPPSPRMLRYAWALLLARIYEVLPLVCPRCGGAMDSPCAPEINDCGHLMSAYPVACGDTAARATSWSHVESLY